ncbi:hypothetical protein Hdeb2414_s0003g00102481 [Helianthus debilis subsp. tardiflorus]
MTSWSEHLTVKFINMLQKEIAEERRVSLDIVLARTSFALSHLTIKSYIWDNTII